MKPLSEIRQWLVENQPTRIRPRIRCRTVYYIPRRGWGSGLDGVMPAAPFMFATLEGDDPLDRMFRELCIPVDQPFVS